MNILVVRFRQMGDAILSTVVMNSLRKTFPQARIDFVLNDRLCPLFEGHPAIDHLIPFTPDERHSLPAYLKKVWATVHATHYDAIIDMRSTPNTLPFSLFSPSTRFRIGLKKGYTPLAFNYTVPPCGDNESMIDHNLAMLKPLERLAPIACDRNFSLSVTEEEAAGYRAYLQASGVSLEKPILLANVTSKLARRAWPKERMAAVMRRFISQFPTWQIIFNYAPGHEEADAREMYEKLGKPASVFIDVQAKSQRQLVALSSAVTLYFGNEGGARHIAQACGKPSLAICSPLASKTTWIPKNDVPAEGIVPADIADVSGLPPEKLYEVITVDEVWRRLVNFMERNNIK